MAPKQKKILAIMQNRQLTVSTAESCSGGLLAASLNELAGSSTIFMGGVVAYDNTVKIGMLGVRKSLLDRVGAVSEEVALAMAKNVRRRLRTDYALATTGIAGPGGGTKTKPVGTVWIAIAGKRKTQAKLLKLSGSRQKIRVSTVKACLELLHSELKNV